MPITPKDFLAYSQEDREKIVKYFKVNRSGGFVVEDDRLISDGHTVDDLLVVDQNQIKKLLKSKDNDTRESKKTEQADEASI
jgi:DNA primase catalytic subunit